MAECLELRCATQRKDLKGDPRQMFLLPKPFARHSYDQRQQKFDSASMGRTCRSAIRVVRVLLSTIAGQRANTRPCARIHGLAPKMGAAYDAPTVSDSVAKWTGVSGPAFPSSVAASKAASVARSRPSSASRAPGEAFIAEMSPVQGRYSLQLSCEVSPRRELNGARRRPLGARRSRLPKQRDLLFQESLLRGAFASLNSSDRFGR